MEDYNLMFKAEVKRITEKITALVKYLSWQEKKEGAEQFFSFLDPEDPRKVLLIIQGKKLVFPWITTMETSLEKLEDFLITNGLFGFMELDSLTEKLIRRPLRVRVCQEIEIPWNIGEEI